MNFNFDLKAVDLQAMADAYERQLFRMARQLREYLKSHPGLEIKFQQPVGAHLKMTLLTAVHTGMVSVSDAALKMFQDLDWLHDAPGAPAPTPLMVEMALELSTRAGAEGRDQKSEVSEQETHAEDAKDAKGAS